MQEPTREELQDLRKRIDCIFICLEDGKSGVLPKIVHDLELLVVGAKATRLGFPQVFFVDNPDDDSHADWRRIWTMHPVTERKVLLLAFDSVPGSIEGLVFPRVRLTADIEEMHKLWLKALDAAIADTSKVDGSVAGAPGDKAGASATHPVDGEDLTILRTLNKEFPQLLDQYAIEGKSSLSRKTIGKRLVALRDAGLTDRPKGDKGGERITDAGRELVRQADAAAH